jgi:asparagine synthase (glutamine-hydrolysing)
LHNDRLSPDVTERFRVSVRFLHALTDPVSGYAPNYGANDGALVLPLSDCDYPDMRPVLQSCHYLAERERLYPPGPWDEEMVWLNGPESRGERQIIVHRSELVANAGGYYTLHSPDSWIMLRAARYKDRPSHADQLHVDMWWRGENVLCDPGTYSYNAPAPFDHAFAGTRFHNCVTVDDADQMTRLSRFLWGDWANAHAHRVENRSDSLCVLEGEHDGYRRFGVRHRRAIVRIPGDNWIIVDDLVGTGHHSLRLHWLTQDVPFETIAPDTIDLKFNAGTMRLFLASSAEAHLDIVRAGRTVSGDPFPLRDPGRGWQSRYYARKEPALSIVMQCSSVLPVRFITVVMLGNPTDPALSASCKNLEIHSSRLALSSVGDTPIFSSSLDVTESPKTATPAQVD